MYLAVFLCDGVSLELPWPHGPVSYTHLDVYKRQDIILLGQNIDEVTDKIEDVLLRMYCNNIKSVRPDALELVAVVIELSLIHI